MSDDLPDIDLLPLVLRDIAALIGLPATMRLVEAYGGTRLYVPKRFDPDHPLVKLLGHDNAARLVEQYGGSEHFDIPFAARAVRALRDREIRRQGARGMTRRELAIRNRISERHIRRIVGGETDDSQGSLF